VASKSQFNNIVEYYSKPLSKDKVTYLNTLHAVEHEKVELYKDFIISLTYLIGDTYLGDDVMIGEEAYKNHFNWCWRKNIDNFRLENLIFEDLGEHYYYFFKYFSDVFYTRMEKTKDLIPKIINFWDDIMSLDKVKTNSEYDLFINLYKIQTKHFKNNFS
jgi:hypothetical protein